MIELRTLGPLEARVNGKPAAPELLWRKNLALLVYLARSPRRTRTREHLMGLLWGDSPATSARHSLREALRVIRGVAGEHSITAEADRVELAEGVVSLDVERLERACAAEAWAEAAGVATGDFLEGFGVPDAGAFEDWLSAERQAIRRRSVDALVREAEALARRGESSASAGLATRAMTLEPLSASAACALMSACALRGERAEALAVYDRFARAFEQATGTAPDTSLRALAERVRKERAPRAAGTPRTGAESRRAPLIGRQAEMEQLIASWEACRAGKATALVIDGDAGTGRTRLAEEVAARARLDGAVTVQLRGTPADREQPWSGIIGLARGGLIDAAGIAAAPQDALAAFATKIEEWGDRFPAARRAEPLGSGPALTAIVRAAAGEQPVLLVADDAHWLDGESLAALQSLLRDCARLPVAVLLTAAPSPPREELETLRTRIGRDIPGVIVAIERLDAAALRDLARWAMPSYSAAETDRLARRLAVDSAGLPLLAVEVLHAVALGLDLDDGKQGAWPAPHRTLDETLPGDLPEQITAAIRIGFRRLSANAQLAVAALAVLGVDTSTAGLARATGLGPQPLADALDEAEWQRWLVADGRGYGFVARITGEVVARDMVTKGQRRRFEDSLTAP